VNVRALSLSLSFLLFFSLSLCVLETREMTKIFTRQGKCGFYLKRIDLILSIDLACVCGGSSRETLEKKKQRAPRGGAFVLRARQNKKEQKKKKEEEEAE